MSLEVHISESICRSVNKISETPFVEKIFTGISLENFSWKVTDFKSHNLNYVSFHHEGFETHSLKIV